MQSNMVREYTRFWRDPDVHNLELLRATFITHAFAPHIHEGFAIGVIDQGAEQFSYRRTTHVAPAGSIVVINPGEVHTGESATHQGWQYRMFYPSASLMQHAASEIGGRTHTLPSFPHPVIDDPVLADMFARLHTSFEHMESPLERASRLLWALSHLVMHHADTRPPLATTRAEPDGVQKVRAYLDAHYAEHTTLEHLSSVAGLSPFHLLRVFRSQVGMPPHAYLTHVRVTQAKQLLAHGVPVAAVAAQTGFVDQSHLTRHFKRMVGVPPGHYQRNSGYKRDTGAPPPHKPGDRDVAKTFWVPGGRM